MPPESTGLFGGEIKFSEVFGAPAGNFTKALALGGGCWQLHSGTYGLFPIRNNIFLQFGPMEPISELLGDVPSRRNRKALLVEKSCFRSFLGRPRAILQRR